jgi:hypothetical protein
MASVFVASQSSCFSKCSLALFALVGRSQPLVRKFIGCNYSWLVSWSVRPFSLCQWFFDLKILWIFRHNFTFPTSYPLTDNTWHLVAVSLDADAMLSLYLDGVMRHTPKRTKGIPGSNALYVWQKGIMRLGYFKVIKHFSSSFCSFR